MSKARDLASAAPAPSTVDATEIGYLNGVTSAIQTQIDAKIGSASAINPTIVDAKGDIIAATAADTVARLAVGANGTVLTAASGQATGLEWATVAAGSNFSLLNSGGTALTAASTITVSGISGQDKLAILVDNSSSVNTNFTLQVRFNSDSGANYARFGLYLQSTTSQQNEQSVFSGNEIPLASSGTSSAGSVVAGYVMVDGCNAAGVKRWWGIAGGNGTAAVTVPTGGVYKGTSTISSVSIISSNGNFDSGTVYIYGSA